MFMRFRLYPGWYTLATELNSTWWTLSKVDKIDSVALTPYTLVTELKGCSIFGRQKSRTFDKFEMFNFGDDSQLWTEWQHIGD